MKITEKQIESDLQNIKEYSARSINPCLTAQYIAISNEKVRHILIQKIKQDYVFQGISCLDKIGIPEYKYVHFGFACAKGTFCLVNPSFVVVMNVVDGDIVSIIDPYISSTGISRNLLQSWGHSREEDIGDIRCYRPSGYSFPPSRFREVMTFEAGGGFSLTVPGANDVPVLIPGRWQAAEENFIKVIFLNNQQTPFTLELLSVTSQRLKVRRHD